MEYNRDTIYKLITPTAYNLAQCQYINLLYSAVDHLAAANPGLSITGVYNTPLVVNNNLSARETIVWNGPTTTQLYVRYISPDGDSAWFSIPKSEGVTTPVTFINTNVVAARLYTGWQIFIPFAAIDKYSFTILEKPSIYLTTAAVAGNANPAVVFGQFMTGTAVMADSISYDDLELPAGYVLRAAESAANTHCVVLERIQSEF